MFELVLIAKGDLNNLAGVKQNQTSFKNSKYID